MPASMRRQTNQEIPNVMEDEADNTHHIMLGTTKDHEPRCQTEEDLYREYYAPPSYCGQERIHVEEGALLQSQI